VSSRRSTASRRWTSGRVPSPARRSVARQGVGHLRASGAATCSCTWRCRHRPKLDDEQEELLRQLAALRGEERPVGQFRTRPASLFSRLRERVQRSLNPGAGGLQCERPGLLHERAGLLAGSAFVLDGAEGRHAARSGGSGPGETVILPTAPGWRSPPSCCPPAGPPGAGPRPDGPSSRARRCVSRSCRRCPRANRGELAVEILTSRRRPDRAWLRPVRLPGGGTNAARRRWSVGVRPPARPRKQSGGRGGRRSDGIGGHASGCRPDPGRCCGPGLHEGAQTPLSAVALPPW